VIALRILIAVVLLGVTMWLIARYAPVVGDWMGRALADILSCNSKKEE